MHCALSNSNWMKYSLSLSSAINRGLCIFTSLKSVNLLHIAEKLNSARLSDVYIQTYVIIQHSCTVEHIIECYTFAIKCRALPQYNDIFVNLNGPCPAIVVHNGGWWGWKWGCLSANNCTRIIIMTIYDTAAKLSDTISGNKALAC